ncbi:MAG TPA: radical SAM protein [bacterium]|nr:radical SAM protein [bacterium]HPQ19477.1 radical SAM protein [bacterium]
MLKDKYKICLINPGFIFESLNFYLCEPLGILYISSYLKKHFNNEIDIKIIDAISCSKIKKVKNYYQYGLNDDEIIDLIKEYKPNLIGISNMFSLRSKEMFLLAEKIKRNLNNIEILVGGIYPTIFPEKTLESKFIDYVIIGEGEESFTNFINAKINNLSYQTIDGFGYKENSEIKIKPKKNFIKNLDILPFPDRESINYEFYINYKMKLYGLGSNRKASIITSRSCPNRCSFCSMYLSHGPHWRARSTENVIEEISYLVDRYKIEELFVMDDNFSLSKKRTLEICEKIIERKIKIKWNTPNGLSANTLDYEVLKKFKESGCKRICIAIESGDEYLRNKIIGKKLSDEKIKEVVTAANKLNLSIFAFYIIGMPEETNESFNKTIKQIKELKLNGVATSFATPLPGTKLYDICIKNNYFVDNKYSQIKFNMPIIQTEHFTINDLIKREKIFYFEFFKSHFFQIIFDSLTGKNDLLNLTFLKRIIYDKLLKFLK